MNIQNVGERIHRVVAFVAQRMQLESWFVLLFAVFSLAFIVLIPPGWNTDEANHVYRIYQLSKGDILSERVADPQTGLKAYGGNVSANLIHLFDSTEATIPGGMGNPYNKIDKHLYVHHPEIFQLKDDGKQQSINFSGAALYSPGTYAIYIPFFWLGSLFSIPFFWVIILCRLIGVVVVGLAFYAAIKYMPVGKWIFFAVGLLPGVVLQAESVGADAPELAACILLIVFVARLLYRPRQLKWWHYVVFVGLGAAVTLIKLVYAPMLLLMLALPLLRLEYRGRKTILLLIGATVLAVIPTLVWSHLVSYIDINSNPHANFVLQRHFILVRPFTYLITLFHTFLTVQQPPLDNLFSSFVAMPAIFSYLAGAAVVASVFVKGRDEQKVPVLPAGPAAIWRTVLLGVTLATTVLVSTALYIYSTTLYQHSIVGIQSRYFLPLLPMVLLVFYGNAVPKGRPVKAVITVLSLIVLAGAVLTLYYRLYQPLPPVA